VGELSGTAAGYEPEAITPVIQPLYGDLWQLMAGSGVSVAGPAIAYYEDTPAGDGAIVVHAAVPVVADSGEEHGYRVVDLAEVASAAAIIHHGAMDDVLSTGQALAPGGSTPAATAPSATPARSPWNGPQTLISGYRTSAAHRRNWRMTRCRPPAACRPRGHRS
jgi:hypothetical protein